jgi:hypothetical protein
MPYTNDFKDMTDADPQMIKNAQREVVTSALLRQIFCPFTKKSLDQANAVVIIPVTGRTIVMHASVWDSQHEEVAATAVSGLEVYDGRELW